MFPDYCNSNIVNREGVNIYYKLLGGGTDSTAEDSTAEDSTAGIYQLRLYGGFFSKCGIYGGYLLGFF